MVLILCLIIICITAVILAYICACVENKSGLFEPFECKNEIGEIKTSLQKLKKEVEEIKEMKDKV